MYERDNYMKQSFLKKGFATLLSGIILISESGCSNIINMESENNKIHVVTTLFCYYDFARAIIGDTENIDLTLLLSPGMESHSFEPTPSDIIEIQQADVLLYNGGHMEYWVYEILDANKNKNGITRCMMDYTSLLEEETDSVITPHNHEHCKDESHHHDDDYIHKEEHEIEYDEHIWSSPVIAMNLVETICDAISEADTKNSEIYHKNAESYIKELQTLDNDFRNVIAEGKRDTLLFADKFPMLYFFKEYGLKYYAAFAGCSTDTEPSTATISNMIEKTKDESIPVVYYFEVSNPAVAEIISEETNATPCVFQSCHTITQDDFNNGETYISLMKRNLEALKIGLQ